MKIKIPRTFKVGAATANVSLKKHLSGDDGFNGTFNTRTGDLRLDCVLIGSKRDRIFAHELMEVIKENYSLHTSEDDMSNIANGWLEFLSQLGVEFDWSDIKEE